MRDTDPQQTFYRKWGYLPPLDEEAVAVIEAIIANSGMGDRRIGPETLPFVIGLQNRNVLLKESAASDPYADHIANMKPEEFRRETEIESQSHGDLWARDLEKCKGGSNEALFQRTVMMFLIARHCLIYKKDGNGPRYLDFSVEEPWSCPPMPTKAYMKGETFLTQPKPDLSVCFCREHLISDFLWYNMPNATKRLACYENMTEPGMDRVFHFCTIEAKKSFLSPDDSVGKRQSLNNASQSLHNMFEFFRDAGPEHEVNFFAKVRFFSVVASTEGLTIRIHRAIKDSGTELGFIVPKSPDRPEYPLRFEHQVFLKARDDFDRNLVLDTFAKILLGYGVDELRLLLQNAAKALMAKLDKNAKEKSLRDNEDFYRYGQTDILPSSRKPTPSARQTLSAVDNSVDMDRSETATPRPKETLTTKLRSAVKRLRGQPSKESVEAGMSRPRKRR